MTRDESSEDLQALETTHRSLDKELHLLTRRAHLTPDEQRRAADLKKRKLSAKDKIYALRRGGLRGAGSG